MINNDSTEIWFFVPNCFVILRETSLLYSKAEQLVIVTNWATSIATVIYSIADSADQKNLCKNTLSEQIWNRWNELDGVKFPLTLLGERPLLRDWHVSGQL